MQYATVFNALHFILAHMGIHPRMSSGLSNSRHPNSSTFSITSGMSVSKSRRFIVLACGRPYYVREVRARSVVNPVCCGIDVHSAVLVACLRRVHSAYLITEERAWVGMRAVSSSADQEVCEKQGHTPSPHAMECAI